MKQQDKDYLYHYTTLDAFINIVKEQEIWASNIFYMNDTHEFHWAVELAKDLLKTEMDGKSPANTDTVELMYNELSRMKPGDLTMSVFACSFSEDGDDLNQWRAYCPNGGVSIGFPRKDLNDITVTQPGTGFKDPFVECIYDDNEQRRLIREEINRAAKTKPGGTIGGKMSDQEKNQWCAEFLKILLANKPIKHPDYTSEKEWRWMKFAEPGIRKDPEQRTRKDAEIVTDPVGFRSRNSLVIPYWKFKLNPDPEKNDMKIWKNCRIVVGPNPHKHELKASIEYMLRYYCNEPYFNRPSKVELSTKPYRYW